MTDPIRGFGSTGASAAGTDAGGGDRRPVLEASDLGRTYRFAGRTLPVLRDVDLVVWPGDFVAVTGPSGSGKSTLLHLLGGIDTPTSGRVRVGGVDVAALSSEKRARLRLTGVGFVFQRFHLLPMLTARENVELPMAEAGTRRRERRERAGILLGRVGLGDREDHRPGELSGGERQRVAVARALANRPLLVLADEPTGELDRDTSAELLELFRELNADGTTLVVATHDLELAAGAGRRFRLEGGRLKEEEAAAAEDDPREEEGT